jgi:hypothetical protein
VVAVVFVLCNCSFFQRRGTRSTSLGRSGCQFGLGRRCHVPCDIGPCVDHRAGRGCPHRVATVGPPTTRAQCGAAHRSTWAPPLVRRHRTTCVAPQHWARCHQRRPGGQGGVGGVGVWAWSWRGVEIEGSSSAHACSQWIRSYARGPIDFIVSAAHSSSSSSACFLTHNNVCAHVREFEII